MLEAAVIPWGELVVGADGPGEVHFQADGTYEVRRPEVPHEAPDLEALVPLDIVDPPIRMSSTTASHWGSSVLSRALKQLGVRPRDVTIAAGVGGSGERGFVITLYRVPGVPRDHLHQAFASVIYRPRRSPWQELKLGDESVAWADGHDESVHFSVAYWARDELVFHVAGDPGDIEAVIRRLG